jgi:hypothetical protein
MAFWLYTQQRVQEMSMGESFVRAVLISGEFETFLDVYEKGNI